MTLLRTWPVRLLLALAVAAAVLAAGAAAPEWTALDSLGPARLEWMTVNQQYVRQLVTPYGYAKRPLWQLLPQLARRLADEPVEAAAFYGVDLLMLVALLLVSGAVGGLAYLVTEPPARRRPLIQLEGWPGRLRLR